MGNPIKENRFFNQEREIMDWEKRKVDLEKKFLKTFQHAFQNSKAYKEIFHSAGIELSDIQGLADLEKLPILHMDQLVERQKKDMPFGGFETIDSSRVRRIYINPGLTICGLLPSCWMNQ